MVYKLSITQDVANKAVTRVWHESVFDVLVLLYSFPWNVWKIIPFLLVVKKTQLAWSYAGLDKSSVGFVTAEDTSVLGLGPGSFVFGGYFCYQTCLLHRPNWPSTCSHCFSILPFPCHVPPPLPIYFHQQALMEPLPHAGPLWPFCQQAVLLKGHLKWLENMPCHQDASLNEQTSCASFHALFILVM